MSSCGNPSTDDDALMPRRLKFDKGRNCIKCKVNPGKIVIRHAVYCKECFSPLVTLKFRRSLEPFVNANAGTSKRPKLKASGSLVLGFSGGLGSTILLDLVHRTYFAAEPSINPGAVPRGGINHPRNTNVWTSCAVCYVEVCNAFPETRDRTEEIMKALASYPKFDFIPLRLENAFDESWWRSVASTEHNWSKLVIELGKDGLFTEALRITSPRTLSPKEALRAYLGSLPTQTAVSSAIKVLIRLLLLYMAQSRRASHLLLGTSLTTLSISLISCISQGAGFTIHEELQEEWRSARSTSEEVDLIRVVRPLRDVTMKECAAFAWWNSIPVVGRDKQTRAIAGIPGLTKDFIVGLEKDYPSTVSTIARTCGKLEPKGNSQDLCILCRRPIQDRLEDWKSRISIRSYSDAKLVADLVHLPTSALENTPENLTTSNQYPSISTHLCYFCHATLTSRSSRASRSAPSSVTPSGQLSPSAPLPLWASASDVQPHTQDGLSGAGEIWVQRVPDETEKRSMIAEFLLDT